MLFDVRCMGKFWFELYWKRGKTPTPKISALLRKTTRFTKGQRKRDDNKNKICAFQGEAGRGAERKIVQNAIFRGKRHDNKILKFQILLSKNFVVMAQAPKGPISSLLLRTENGLTTDTFVVKCTGRGLVVKRPGVLSKVQTLDLVLGVGVFSLLPTSGATISAASCRSPNYIYLLHFPLLRSCESCLSEVLMCCPIFS